MDVINLAVNNLANISTTISDSINKYTEHTCRSVSMKPVMPFECDLDILYDENNRASVGSLIDNADVFHLNSWNFMKLIQRHPVSMYGLLPGSMKKTVDSIYSSMYGAGFLPKKLPPIENIRWAGLMYNINKKKLDGKKVLLHYHGGDLRRVMPKDDIDFINNKKLSAVLDIPDLLPYLDNGIWQPLPTPTESDLYKPPAKRDDSIIKIVHTPTRKDMKKTDALVKAVETLKKSYDVELMLIENTPYKQCLTMKKEAHISFDNIQYGSYAGCSIEAMCHEQASLVYLNDITLREIDRVSEEVGLECPLVNVGGPEQPSVKHLNRVAEGKAENVITKEDYDSVYSNLKQLIEDSALRKDIGRQGRKWAHLVHNEKVVAKKLIKIYDSLEAYHGQ